MTKSGSSDRLQKASRKVFLSFAAWFFIVPWPVMGTDWISALTAGPSAQARELALLLPFSGGVFGDRRVQVEQLPRQAQLRSASRAVAFISTRVESGTGDRVRLVSDAGSGVLVSPCLVLTARHILGPKRGADLRRTIEVQFTEARLLPGARPPVRQAQIIAEGRDEVWVNDDWALLRLDRPVHHIRPIVLTENRPLGGAGSDAIALIGYPADRLDEARPSAWVDPVCGRVRPLANAMLAIQCQATSGNSGGPVLSFDGEWKLLGILTRATGPRLSLSATSYALPPPLRLRQALEAASCPPSELMTQD